MNNTIEGYLSGILAQTFTTCGYDSKYAHVLTSSRPELSQFQCNGAMPLANQAKKNPMEIAQQIVDAVTDKSMFADISVVKPGFINITLTNDFLAKWSNNLAADQRLGCPSVETPRNVVIDFGGPNVAKPMHVGHIRSTLIGDCLQRVYRFCGDNVTSDVHLGDWGTQMGMLIEAVKKEQPNLPYFDENYEGEYPTKSPVTVQDLAVIYPKASGLCKGDDAEMEKARQATAELQNGRKGYRALWRHFVKVSVAELKKDFANLGVEFDLWQGESDAQQVIPEMVESLRNQGLAEESEGALVVHVAKNESDKTPPLILLKSDGAVMYGTTDLATIVERVADLQAKLILYVVDQRQSLHFKQVFTAADKCGISPNTDMVHVGFGTVNGKDGKPFKTRAGGVMKLSALIDEAMTKAHLRSDGTGMDEAEKSELTAKVAMATVKFADLANLRTSDYIFDLDKFSQFEGKTGPYLLYSAVRVKSILRKAEEADVHAGEILPAEHEAERNLQLAFAQLPAAIHKTYSKCEPHHLCDFAYALAAAFSRFYTECPILNEQNEALQASRLGLATLTLNQMELVLGLLGIDIPEKM